PGAGDVGGAVGVAERGRERAHQAQHRGGDLQRVAVGEHVAGVGVGGGQRLGVHQVHRRLELPAPGATGLQQLQDLAVPGVGAGVVGGEEPAQVPVDVVDG